MKCSLVEQGQIFRIEPRAHRINFDIAGEGALEDELSREERLAQNRR